MDRTPRAGLVELVHNLLGLEVCGTVEEAAALAICLDDGWVRVGDTLALPSFAEPSFATPSFA